MSLTCGSRLFLVTAFVAFPGVAQTSTSSISGTVRNRTFFFGSWAGQKINFAQLIDQTYGVPALYTPAAASGIFRYLRPDPEPVCSRWPADHGEFPGARRRAGKPQAGRRHV